jgi:hypothetical protein
MCKSLDVSRPHGKGDGLMENRRSLVDHPRLRPLASGDSTYTYSQIVAALWLKCGVKSLNIEASSHCKIFSRDATIS